MIICSSEMSVSFYHTTSHILLMKIRYANILLCLQVCKLLRHTASTDMLQVSAKYAEINLRIYGPQVVTAAHTLSIHPTSKIAKENVEGNGNSY
jgi:hypothetical protein